MLEKVVISANWSSFLEKGQFVQGFLIQPKVFSILTTIFCMSPTHSHSTLQIGTRTPIEVSPAQWRDIHLFPCALHITFFVIHFRKDSACTPLQLSSAFSQYSCTGRYFSFDSCLLLVSFLITVLCSCLGWTPSCWFWITSPKYLDCFKLKSGPSKYFKFLSNLFILRRL